MRKLLAISLASVGPVLLATTVLVAGGGDHDGAARQHDPTSSEPSTTSTTVAPAAVVPAEPVDVSSQPAARPPDRVGEALPGTTSPGSSEDVAVSVFDAWLHGNDRLLRELATESVADFLAARTPHEPGEWSGPRCDGAAGSTYCGWSQPGVELVIRVGNEAVAEGRDHAVMEAFVWVPAGSVAIWPFATADQAAAAQAGVDQGHQPWLLDPATVAAHYVQAELGWPDAQILQTSTQTATYGVTDPASGAHATVALAQPRRQGPTGIWAVIRAGST
jgi:hypothetical protein